MTDIEGRHRRASDRYVTPGVIVAFLFLAAVVVCSLIGVVGYLTAIGRDPDPMLRLVAQVVGALTTTGTFILQLVGRSTVAKVERNTGLLASKVDTATEAAQEAASKVDAALWVDEQLPSHTQALPPVPPPVATRPHPFSEPRT